MDDLTLRRLLPEPAGDVTAAEAYAADRPARDGRPWVLVSMVASLDGATAIGGVSGGLGGPGDRLVFAALRSLADIVLVGAATVRAEGYGAPRKVGQRIAVVSRSGDVDLTSPLVTSGAALLVTAEDGPQRPVPTVRAGRGGVDLAAALAVLHAEHGAGVVSCEGGPSLNAQLLAADLVDEVCLTVAPLAVAGGASRVAEGAVSELRRFRLAHVLEHAGELHLRYVRQ
jgi:riboflavin biosynthesis pyrimidine reductase